MSDNTILYERVNPAGGSRLERLMHTAKQAQAQLIRLTAMEAERAAELVHLRLTATITASATPTELAEAARARTLITVYEEALSLIAQAKQEAQLEQNWAKKQLQSRLDGLAEAEATYHASQAADQLSEQDHGRDPNASLADSQQRLDWLWRQDTGQPYLISVGDGA